MNQANIHVHGQFGKDQELLRIKLFEARGTFVGVFVCYYLRLIAAVLPANATHKLFTLP